MALISNLIDTTLSDEDLERLLSAVQSVRDGLPLQTALTPDQRARMVKMGQSMVGFVDQALRLAEADDSYLPRLVSVDKFRNDVTLMKQLQQLRNAVTQLVELLDDNYLVASSEAYKHALVVYQAAKAYGPEDVQPVVAEMGQMFSGGSSPENTTSQTSEEPATD